MTIPPCPDRVASSPSPYSSSSPLPLPLPLPPSFLSLSGLSPPFVVARQWPFKLSTLPTSSSSTGTYRKGGTSRRRRTREDTSINPTPCSTMEGAPTHAREGEKPRFPPTIPRRSWSCTLCSLSPNLSRSSSTSRNFITSNRRMRYPSACGYLPATCRISTSLADQLLRARARARVRARHRRFSPMISLP